MFIQKPFDDTNASYNIGTFPGRFLANTHQVDQTNVPIAVFNEKQTHLDELMLVVVTMQRLLTWPKLR